MTRRLPAALLLAAAALLLSGMQARAEDEVGSPDIFQKPDEPESTHTRKYYSLGARGGPWLGLLDATIRMPVAFTSGPISGSGKLSTKIVDDETVPYGEVFATLKYLSIYADYWRGLWRDEAQTDGDFRLNGIDFTGSRDIKLEADILSAGGRIQVNPIAWDWLELGISIGGRYLRVDGEVKGEEPISGDTVSEKRRIEAPIPQLGASVTLFFGEHIDVYARARGLVASWEQYDISNVEGELGFAFNFLAGHVSVGAEYRAFWLELDDFGRRVNGEPQTQIDALLHGPLVYLRLRF